MINLMSYREIEAGSIKADMILLKLLEKET